MIRSRITAAAIGATVLGVSAVLVPTASTAQTNVVGASSTVTWADTASAFKAVPNSDTIPLNDQLYFLPLGSSDAESITDVATLDEDGLSVSDGEGVALIRGLTKPVGASDLGALAGSVQLTTTGATSFAFAVQAKDDASDQSVYYSVDGEWYDARTGETDTTAEFAADLKRDGSEVVGYIAFVGVDVGADLATPPPATDEPAPTPTDEPTAEPTATPTGEPTAEPTGDPTTEPTPTDTPSAEPTAPAVPGDLKSLASPLGSSALPLAADATGSLSALRVDDTTTYFTPQPTATVQAPESTPISQTLTGFQVTGSGYAPVETVGAVVTQGDKTFAIRTNASVSDDEGDVVVVVTLPEGAVTAGAYTVTLTGFSSGQTASATSTFVADAGTAPVAVPVPGTAAFTG